MNLLDEVPTYILNQMCLKYGVGLQSSFDKDNVCNYTFGNKVSWPVAGGQFKLSDLLEVAQRLGATYPDKALGK